MSTAIGNEPIKATSLIYLGFNPIIQPSVNLVQFILFQTAIRYFGTSQIYWSIASKTVICVYCLRKTVTKTCEHNYDKKKVIIIKYGIANNLMRPRCYNYYVFIKL